MAIDLLKQKETEPVSQYYSDSLLIKPSFSRTVFDNLAMSFTTPVVALTLLNDDMAKSPLGDAIRNIHQSLQITESTPGIGPVQQGAGFISNMIGYGLNPITWGTAGIGGLAARGIIAGTERLLPQTANVFLKRPLSEILSKSIAEHIPSTIGKVGSEKTLSSALIGEKALKTFSSGFGAGIPAGIVENYNNDTRHIAWGGVAKSAGEMGAFGLAIGSIPFAMGILRAKAKLLNDKVSSEKVVSDAEIFKEAFEKGQITEEDYLLFKDYESYKNDPGNQQLKQSLEQRASKFVQSHGTKVDTVSNEAMVDMIKSDDMNNLQGAIADQMTSDLPENYRTALSDFIIHNNIDELRNNPASIEGLRGYFDFVQEKLQHKEAKLKEADNILNEHFLKSVDENMGFSQKAIDKMANQFQLESSHLKNLSLTIPENLVKRFKSIEKINYLKTKLNEGKKKEKPINRQTLKRIETLEKELPKVLTPKEELLSLRQKFLSDKGLPKNWQISKEYHRLEELSQVWHNARTLLDRIHLEDQYNRQEAFKDVVGQILKISDSDYGKIANPEHAMDYIRKRVEGHRQRLTSSSEEKFKVEVSRDIPSDSDDIIQQQEKRVESSSSEYLKKEFHQSKEKFIELRDKPNVFKNLISCVIGGLLNGE